MSRARIGLALGLTLVFTACGKGASGDGTGGAGGAGASAGRGGGGRGGAGGTSSPGGIGGAGGIGGVGGSAGVGGGTGIGGGGTGGNGIGGSGAGGTGGSAAAEAGVPEVGPSEPDSAPDGPAPTPGALPAFCASYPPAAGSVRWQSAHVKYEAGRLVYAEDAGKNRIPDFSYAGYRHGEAEPPELPEVMRLMPMPGDNTARVQAAIDAVGARPLDAMGLRGALVLAPGRFEIAGTLRVNHAGVVLRGSGDGGDPTRDTILVATGDTPHQRTVIIAGSGTRAWAEAGPRINITTPFVQVSATSFELENVVGLAAGDPVIIRHPSSQAWIDALGGGGASDAWTPNSRDIIYNRFIKSIAGNTVTLDAPVFNHLDRRLTQSTLAKATMTYARHIGVENLRIDIVTAGGEDENHAWKGLQFHGAIDSWARKVTALHFGWAGVEAAGSTRITVDDATANEPVAVRTGGRMYNFAMEPLAQLVLVRRCVASNGRHSLVGSGASTTSGNVFYRCRMNSGGAVEGGHRQWTQAMLYDNVTESASSTILLINRGDFGTAHGWGCAHSVVWNFNSRMAVQKPPTAQNYAISTAGSRATSYSFPGPDGSYELNGAGLGPASLYEAQLCERLRR